MRIVAAAILASAAVLPAATVSGPPSPEELRDCGTRAEGRGPQRLPSPPGFKIGPLVIWPSIRDSVSTSPVPGWPYLVKAPIVVPARTKLVLAIGQDGIGRAAFQSHRRGYVSSVRFEACPENKPAFAYKGTVGPYTGFPFAIELKQKASCIPMDVWVDGRAAPFHRVVPIGRRSC